MKVQAIGSVAPKQNVAFSGKVADGVATAISKVGNSDAFVKGMEKIGSSKNLMANLSTASSAVTTGLYIYKTLTDKKKDKNQKITFAINQALTFAVSTAITYTALGAMKNSTNKLVGKFADAVSKRDGKCSETLRSGAKSAIDLVTCGFINRYLSPVAVTPIANKLGDKVTDFLNKRDAEKAQQKELKANA